VLYPILLTDKTGRQILKFYRLRVWGCKWNPKIVTIQLKVPEQYFPVVLFIILYNEDSMFESVYEFLTYDHSTESKWTILFCGAVFCYTGDSNFCVCGWSVPIRLKPNEQFILVVLLVTQYYTITKDNARAVIGQYLLIIIPVNHMENVIII